MVFVPKSIQYKIQKGRLKDLVPQSNQPTLPILKTLWFISKYDRLCFSIDNTFSFSGNFPKDRPNLRLKIAKVDSYRYDNFYDILSVLLKQINEDYNHNKIQ